VGVGERPAVLAKKRFTDDWDEGAIDTQVEHFVGGSDGREEGAGGDIGVGDCGGGGQALRRAGLA